MKKTVTTLIALSMLAPMLSVAGAPAAEARRYAYKEWRGADGKTYCRKSDGTVGLVVGGVTGAVVGRAIDTRGERATGTILGAAAGALVGREIARKRSCR